MKFSLQKIQNHIVEPLPEMDVLREKIIFHAFEVESVEGDEIDIKVLPDRAADAKDERGMAREIAGLFKLTLKEADQYDRGGSFAFSIAKVALLLGREVSAADLKEVFDAYHYEYEINGDEVVFFLPPWRKDLVDVHDIADEVGRYLGYDTVEAILPVIEKKVEINPEFATISKKRSDMIAQGYNEVMTYSLVKKGDYQVAKGPKGKDFLRTNLLGELRKAYELNKQNTEILPNHSAKIFEIGRVFPKSGEELHVAWIDEHGEHEEALHDSKIYTEYEISKVASSETKMFSPWSEFPFITRDIALWIPETTSPDEVIEILRNNATDLCTREPRLFDTFQKDGKVSVAFRLVFQSSDRTLTNDEIDPIMSRIYIEVQRKGWEVR